MTDAADDLRDREELWDELRVLHDHGKCDVECPYCEIEGETVETADWGARIADNDKTPENIDE